MANSTGPVVNCEACGEKYLATEGHECAPKKPSASQDQESAQSQPSGNKYVKQPLISGQFIAVAIAVAVVIFIALAVTFGGMVGGLAKVFQSSSSISGVDSTCSGCISTKPVNALPLTLTAKQIAQGYTEWLSSGIAYRYLTSNESSNMVCASSNPCGWVRVFGLNNCDRPQIELGGYFGDISGNPDETVKVDIKGDTSVYGLGAGDKALVEGDFSSPDTKNFDIQNISCN